jgi:hypothetical protein
VTPNHRKAGFPSRRIVSAAMLALAFAGAAGCSSKHELTPEQQAQADLAAYETEIRRIIPDPARADQLVALTNQFQQMTQESIANMNQYQAKASALNSDYQATRDDYEALFTRQDAAREAFLQKAGALRERMVVFTSDSEWEQLKAARLKTLEADLQQLMD